MTELERIARQYVHENALSLGEKLALSVFVMRENKLLEQQQQRGAAAEGVTDFSRGWYLEEI